MATASRPIAARLPCRPLKLREWVETMTNPDHSPLPTDQHVLLMPLGLRIEDDGEVLHWDRIELRPVAPPSTRRCLWEFAALANANDDEKLAFIQRWGLLDWGEDQAILTTDVPAWRALAEWDAAVRTTEAWLRVFAATEEEALLSPEELWPLVQHLMAEVFIEGHFGIPDDWRWLGGWTDPPSGYTPPGWKPLNRDLRQPEAWDDYWERRAEVWEANWQMRSRAGQALASQRWIVSGVLWFLMEPHVAMMHLYWDDHGRRVEHKAYGVMEIVTAHMAAIFSAPLPDVYRCSVCGRAYELPGDRARRPRQGTRRLCSDPCRLAARRASNLEAWHRNKDQWRRRGKENDANADANPGGRQ